MDNNFIPFNQISKQNTSYFIIDENNIYKVKKKEEKRKCSYFFSCISKR